MSLKKIQFFDGFTSETQPNLTDIQASNLITYTNDAAYESAQGAAQEGDMYANTTDNVVRYYNGTSWVTIATLADINTHAALTTTHGVTGDIVGTTDTQTLSAKTLTSPVLNTSVSGTAIKDEDDMASDSATHLCTQQSIKKYVDDNAGGSLSTTDKSANYTILDGDGFDIIRVTTGSSANVVITLPTLADNSNRIIEIVKADSGTKFVEIAPEGSETVRGSTTSIYAIQQGESIKLQANSSDWMLLGDPFRTVSIAITASTGAVKRDNNVRWWSSISNSGSGDETINYYAAVFPIVLPIPVVACEGNSGINFQSQVTGITTTAIRVRSGDGSTGSFTDVDWYLVATGLK